MYISKAILEKVQQIFSIEEVIGDFIQLKRKGKNLWANCPFHDEKTPSFCIDPIKGFYKCFGCGVAGDGITFVKNHQGISFPEAVKYIAKKYGIQISDTKNSLSKILLQKKDQLYVLFDLAKQYFVQNLQTQKGKKNALKYLESRKISLESIEKFELGYALDNLQACYEHFINLGYSEEILQEAGFIQKKNQISYDTYANRILFPIHNTSGKIIGFGARAFKAHAKAPKYLNSPESEIFHKQNMVYGIYQAKQSIQKNDFCYLVEGYTDLIALHQINLSNTVASLGTSLTRNQVQLIRKYTKNIILLFDGDEAGKQAIARSIDLILEEGLQVKIVTLPNQKDPDIYIQQEGEEAFKKYITQNVYDFIHFYWQHYQNETLKNEPWNQVDLIHTILKSIAKIPHPITQTIFIKQCSQITGIAEEILIEEIKVFSSTKVKSKIELHPKKSITPLFVKDEKRIFMHASIVNYEQEIIRNLLNYGHVYIDHEFILADYLFQELSEIQFVDSLYQEIFNLFQKAYAQKKTFTIKELLHHYHNQEAIQKQIINLSLPDYVLSKNWYKKLQLETIKPIDHLHLIVFKKILKLKYHMIQKLILNNQTNLQKKISEEDENKFLKIHLQLKEKEKEITKHLGIILIP